MQRVLYLTLLGLLSGASIPAFSMAAPCTDLLPKPSVASQPRDITAEDLVRLRDIGPVSAHDTEAHILSLSPDGTRVAFQLRRADPVTNTYCLGMVVLSTQAGGRPVLVDQGGEFILDRRAQDGFAETPPSGAALLITPKWSPDAQWIAYLRRDNGITQVWKARADGAGASVATQADFDIETFDWSEDGRSLLVSGRPSIRAAAEAIKTEARTGFLYDDRFIPLAGNKPRARGDFPLGQYRVRVDGQGPQPLVPVGASLEGDSSQDRGQTSVGSDAALKTAKAWTERVDPSKVNSASVLHVRFGNGEGRAMPIPRLQGISGFWWSPDKRSLYFMRTEGWGHGWHASQQGLYRWDQDAKAPERIWLTDDVLIGCQIDKMALICGQESSTTPRRLVRLDLTSHKIETLFDPNPEFASIRLGQVQRLTWTNDLGYQAFGDLVLPPDHKPGQTHPLVVVQYFSRGFLRGGTGDDYPVFLLAAQGFAVLDFEMPPNYSSLQPDLVGSYDELNRMDFDNWRNRRHVLSALESGIHTAIGTGTVDATRIGLTGLSDGWSTMLFALLNGRIHYSAMATSSCCGGSTVTGMLDGPVGARVHQAMGYPKLTQAAPAFWNVFSMRQNASRIHTPLLIQVPDDEYIGALEGYTALKEFGKPAEMYVFPDEHHVKWQPAHRLATYTRSVDWFRFWMQGVEDPSPDKAAQYRRWEALRAIPAKDMTVTPGA